MTDYEKARARLYFRLMAHNAAVDAIAAAATDPGIGKCKWAPRGKTMIALGMAKRNDWPVMTLKAYKPQPEADIAENDRMERMMGRFTP